MDILKKLGLFLGETGIMTGDVEQNLAKGHVPVLGMTYRKKKRKNRLTGHTIVHEKECPDGYYWCDKKDDHRLKDA